MEAEPDLDECDLRIDVFTNTREAWARIVHLPTGVVAVGHDAEHPESSWCARQVALKQLRVALAENAGTSATEA